MRQLSLWLLCPVVAYLLLFMWTLLAQNALMSDGDIVMSPLAPPKPCSAPSHGKYHNARSLLVDDVLYISEECKFYEIISIENGNQHSTVHATSHPIHPHAQGVVVSCEMASATAAADENEPHFDMWLFSLGKEKPNSLTIQQIEVTALQSLLTRKRQEEEENDPVPRGNGLPSNPAMRAADWRESNIVVLFIDALSHDDLPRLLPETAAYLAKLHAEQQQNDWMHVFAFENYNAVGGNSLPNQLALFTGMLHSHHWQILQKEEALFSAVGTADDTLVPLFTLNNSQATSFYITDAYFQEPSSLDTIGSSVEYPFGLFGKISKDVMQIPLFQSNRARCIGSGLDVVEATTSVLREFLRLKDRKARKKFAYWGTDSAHEASSSVIRNNDVTIARTLQFLVEETHSLIFLLSDHGLSYGDNYQKHRQARKGHRNPLLQLLVPSTVWKAKPEWKEALSFNSKRLVVATDVYQTFRDLASYWNSHRPPSQRSAPLIPTSQSLLHKISADRTCEDLGIPDKFCLHSNPFKFVNS
jgi:hypothetical protein